MYILKYVGKKETPITFGKPEPEKEAWLTKPYTFSPTSNVRDVDAEKLIKANPRMFKILSKDGKEEEVTKVEIIPDEKLAKKPEKVPDAKKTLGTNFAEIDKLPRTDLMAKASELNLKPSFNWDNKTLKSKIKDALKNGNTIAQAGAGA